MLSPELLRSGKCEHALESHEWRSFWQVGGQQNGSPATAGGHPRSFADRWRKSWLVPMTRLETSSFDRSCQRPDRILRVCNSCTQGRDRSSNGCTRHFRNTLKNPMLAFWLEDCTFASRNA
jgi:hypothetical protein